MNLLFVQNIYLPVGYLLRSSSIRILGIIRQKIDVNKDDLSSVLFRFPKTKNDFFFFWKTSPRPVTNRNEFETKRFWLLRKKKILKNTSLIPVGWPLILNVRLDFAKLGSNPWQIKYEKYAWKDGHIEIA